MLIINKQPVPMSFQYNINKQYLIELPKIYEYTENIQILYSPKEFRKKLLDNIKKAKNHIYLIALYFEQDQAGQEILETLFQIKKNKKSIKITIIVDWHRAQRGRIGEKNTKNNTTNTDWYLQMTNKYSEINIPIYGVTINIREALGVLHLKGHIIDNKVIYSGSNINNTYLHKQKTYRHDRYHIIENNILATSMLNYIEKYILQAPTTRQLNIIHKNKNIKKIKNKQIRLFRHTLQQSHYFYSCNNPHNNQHKTITSKNKITLTPIVGLGKKNTLNQTIQHLICSTNKNIILCTPYFNISKTIKKNLINLLKQNKYIEIIVGDKTANDFYTHDIKKFNFINILPYLYEINLRLFLKKLQYFLDKKQLTIKIWKHGKNTYHIKGIWIDDEWQLLTGNNLNPRAWNLDLENAILIHDPHKTLLSTKQYELHNIYKNTKPITHYSKLQSIDDYPIKIRTIIQRLKRIHLDKIINHIV